MAALEAMASALARIASQSFVVRFSAAKAIASPATAGLCSFCNTGVNWGKEPADYGRFEVTGKEPDRGNFKVPTLLIVILTAP